MARRRIYATIFRFSNTWSAAEWATLVIFDLIQKLRKNPKALPIWGDGKGQKNRTFSWRIASEGMLAAAYNIPPDARPLCDTYNLGCSTFTKVDRVAEIVCEEMGLKDVELVHEGGRHGFLGDVPFVRIRRLQDGFVRVARVSRILG